MTILEPKGRGQGLPADVVLVHIQRSVCGWKNAVIDGQRSRSSRSKITKKIKDQDQDRDLDHRD